MSELSDARRRAGAAIRASVPRQEIRFPRHFGAAEVEAMPRIAFSRGIETGWFISREREGSRYYSQGVGYLEADAEDCVWQATSWDEAFLCLTGRFRMVVTDGNGAELVFSVEPGEYFWAPAGFRYRIQSVGVEATCLVTTAPQMPSGWRHTGDDESYSDVLIGLRPGH
jgi:mannose-6-phosphate isomerase-like protein (cupin superfamily)